MTRVHALERAYVKAGTLQGAIFNTAYFSSTATDECGVIQIFNAGTSCGDATIGWPSDLRTRLNRRLAPDATTEAQLGSRQSAGPTMDQA